MHRLKRILLFKATKPWHSQVGVVGFGLAVTNLFTCFALVVFIHKHELVVTMNSMLAWIPHIFVACSLTGGVAAGAFEMIIGKKHGYAPRPTFIGACTLALGAVVFGVFYGYYAGMHSGIFILELTLFILIPSVWIVYDSRKYSKKL